MKKTKQMNVRLSDEEYEQLKVVKKHYGKSVTWVLLQGARKMMEQVVLDNLVVGEYRDPNS